MCQNIIKRTEKDRKNKACEKYQNLSILNIIRESILIIS